MATLLENIPELAAGGDSAGRAVGRSVGLAALAIYVPVAGAMLGGINDMTKTTADYKNEVAGVYDALGGFGGFANSAQDQAFFMSDYNALVRQDIVDYNDLVVRFNQAQHTVDVDIATYTNDMEVARRMAANDTAWMAQYQQGQEQLRRDDIAALTKERQETLAELRASRAAQQKRQVMKMWGGEDYSAFPNGVNAPAQVFEEPDYDIITPTDFKDLDMDANSTAKVLIALAALAVLVLS